MLMRFLAWPRLKFVLWAAIMAQGLLAVWISKPWMTADSVEYLKLAEALAHGEYGSMTATGFQPDVLRPPGYPIILCGLHHGLRLPLWAISLIQVAALWGALFLVQRMLERFRVNAAPMLALAAIYPFPAMYSANLMTEAWAALAVTGIAALLVLGERSRLAHFAVGLIGGIGVLLRADLALLPPLAAVVIFMFGRNATLGRRARDAAISLAGAGLVVLPYSAWNYAHFGQAKPIPLAGALGNSLYIASWQLALPLADLNALYEGVVTPRAEAAGLGREVRAMNAAIGAPLQTAPWNPAAYPTRAMQVASTKYTLNYALRRIADQPLAYARHIAGNSWQLWNTGEYPPTIPRLESAMLMLVSAAVFIAGMAGVILTLIRPAGWPLPCWLVLPFAYVPLIHLFLHLEARYTAPARPLLVLFAGAFCWWLGRLVIERRARRRSI